MQRLTIISCNLLVIWFHWTGAFIVSPTSTSTRRSENPIITSTTTTAPNNGIFMAARNLEELESSYGEQSRPYRRDFFTHDSWVRHRSRDRFTNNLLNMYESGFVRRLIDECIFVGFVATSICFFNAFCSVGYDDLVGIHHEPLLHFQTLKLPMQPFTLSSPALGLLLLFRKNASYQRWDEARKAWGVVVNNSRTIARQTSAWIKYSDLPFDEKQRLLKRIRDTVWAFPRSLARHLLSEREDEENYCQAVREQLDEPFASELIRWKRHRPSRALFEMSNAINELPLEMYRRIAIDESVSHLCDAMGGCDRIYTSPVPSVYTRHTARFLEIWILFLPLCLWQVMGSSWNHIATIPVAIVISYFFLGIEELAIQLEEPFSLLPLHKIAEGIGKSADEHFDWNETDERRRVDINNNGIMTNEMVTDPSNRETEAQTYTLSLAEAPPAATRAEAQINQAAHSYESLAESWKMMNGDH